MGITIQDIVYVRYQAPDLDIMQSFLEDFGLKLSARTERALYMRGTSSTPHIHITELGTKPTALGLGLLAPSYAALEDLASETGAKIEETGEPGGGVCIRLTDPAGMRVEVLFGQDKLQELTHRAALTMNPAMPRARFGDVQRPMAGPSHVVRLGHTVIHTPHFRETMDYYQKMFGMRPSDTYYAGQKENMIGAFLHCGLDKTYTDHHTIAILAGEPTGFDHCAFEVVDFDDLMLGNQYLLEKNHSHSWGVGRHVAGSQIFDYWRDPFDNKIEHWTDGDLVNDDYEPVHTEVGPSTLAQWGPPLEFESFAKLSRFSYED
ncbi:VOC family protein [Acidocella sp.]|uniref:VOC family protein n=1 Tax=Acidocella sp. TaxID=50710 RepID=UPI003CFC8EEC